jgi:hypothetical protein
VPKPSSADGTQARQPTGQKARVPSAIGNLTTTTQVTLEGAASRQIAAPRIFPIGSIRLFVVRDQKHVIGRSRLDA